MLAAESLNKFRLLNFSHIVAIVQAEGEAFMLSLIF